MAVLIPWRVKPYFSSTLMKTSLENTKENVENIQSSDIFCRRDVKSLFKSEVAGGWKVVVTEMRSISAPRFEWSSSSGSK